MSFTETVALDVAGAIIYVIALLRAELVQSLSMPTWKKSGLRTGISSFKISLPGDSANRAAMPRSPPILASDENYCVGQILGPNGGLMF